MEGVIESEQAILGLGVGCIAPLAAEFERSLPRLSAAIAEKDPIGERILDQHLRQLHRGNGVVKIGYVHQLSRLFLDRLEHVIIAIAKSINR